jgi:hypothetical protein
MDAVGLALSFYVRLNSDVGPCKGFSVHTGIADRWHVSLKSKALITAAQATESPMGPITLFDKSFVQAISLDEAVWFDRFFMPVVCPVCLR